MHVRCGCPSPHPRPPHRYVHNFASLQQLRGDQDIPASLLPAMERLWREEEAGLPAGAAMAGPLPGADAEAVEQVLDLLDHDFEFDEGGLW